VSVPATAPVKVLQSGETEESEMVLKMVPARVAAMDWMLASARALI